MVKTHIHTQPPTWLGHKWRNRAWLHPLFGSATVMAIGQALHETNFIDDEHWYVKTALAVSVPLVGTTAGFFATVGSRFSDAARAYCVGCGFAAGTWLAASTLTSPYSAYTGTFAAAAAVLSWVSYPGMRHAQLDWEARRRAFYADRNVDTTPPILIDERSDEQRKWENLFVHIGAPGVTFVERIPTACGFKIHLRLPDNGKITYSTFSVRKLGSLEIATGMPAGSISAEPAMSKEGRTLARDMWLTFDVEDVLSQILDMPEDHTPLSINNAFPVGRYADGEIIYLKLREVAALIVGVRGRGKTNFLNIIIHQLSRCTDVIIGMIDLKGGRAVKPWLQPWIDGKMKRPIFDWIATNRTEAHYMLVGMRALIDQRGASGMGGSKIKPTPKLPAVIIICDEIAALVGMRSGPRSARDGQGETSYALANILTGGIQLGRSEAVDFVLATQRSTVTMIGNGDLKSQCELRIGLGVTNPADARSIFEGNSVAAHQLTKLRDKATRGGVLIQDGDGGRVAIGKSYFMGDDDEQMTIYKAAIAHAEYINELDPRGQAAIETALRNLTDGAIGYHDRWSADRIKHLYNDMIEYERDDDDADDDDADNSSTHIVQQTPRDRKDRHGERRRESSFFPSPSKKTISTQTPAVVPSQSNNQDHWDAEWAKIVDKYESSEAPETEYTEVVETDDEDDEIDRQKRMIEVIDEFGIDGAMPGQILAKMVQEGTAWKHRTSMYPALKRALKDRQIVQPGGKKGRYFTPRNVT